MLQKAVKFHLSVPEAKLTRHPRLETVVEYEVWIDKCCLGAFAKICMKLEISFTNGRDENLRTICGTNIHLQKSVCIWPFLGIFG